MGKDGLGNDVGVADKKANKILSQGFSVATDGGFLGAEALETGVRDASNEGLSTMPVI